MTLLAPGSTSIVPTVASNPEVCRASSFRGQDDLGRRGQGIAPEMHRHGARVPRFSGERGQNPALTGDRRHHPNRRVNGLQIRPLLDVDFDVRERFAGLQRGCRPAHRDRRRTPSSPRAG